ncbi:F-box/LRR-repeat protein [Thalictrum thalictroides]|uniref:F-box/LRR-repeat protein n=1 Tax=Thalictrum thalictroides TaxID=46969 RepID=A0A7J6V845_THATH|nr:F-box/LRR-repeat protein [Thalictrum thalictroides]
MGENNIVHHVTNIIDLPEAMIHHITSSLSLRDMAYMSISSKRWRYLCYTTPYINIDKDKVVLGNLPKQLSSSFLKFVNRLFILHLNNLQRLTISCADLVDEYVVESWILKAIECSVQELDLTIPANYSFNPRGIFTLPSLRILKLNLNNAFLKSIYCIKLTNLHTLSLTYVWLPFPYFLNLFPSLKTLSLYDCYGFATLSLISSSLETLSIIQKAYSSISINDLDIYCDTLKTLNLDLASPNQLLKTFKLSAPNVHTFACSAVALNCHVLKPLNSLKDATIYIYNIHVVNDWELVKNFGSQLLTHVNHAKVLRLCSQYLQILAGMMIAAPVSTLSNLEHLTLFTHKLNNWESSSIIYILQRSSNMKTLKISREYYCCVIPEVSNEIIQQMEFVHHLKLVEMSLLGDGETNLKLLKYLFNTGKALEQITIFYDSLTDSNIAKRFDQKLSVIQKTSSSPFARLSFLPN